MKPADVVERIVVAQLALDDEVPHPVSEKMWAETVAEVEKNPVHHGDCTKEPQTCLLCFVKNRRRAALDLMVYVGIQEIR